jgi:hypothetical protein
LKEALAKYGLLVDEVLQDTISAVLLPVRVVDRAIMRILGQKTLDYTAFMIDVNGGLTCSEHLENTFCLLVIV